jgi:hypothetical protein
MVSKFLGDKKTKPPEISSQIKLSIFHYCKSRIKSFLSSQTTGTAIAFLLSNHEPEEGGEESYELRV